MTDLEQKKLEAEIALIAAETEKARAEAVKAAADSKASQKSWHDWSLEAIKIVGAIALGIGGVTAAITGYELSEVKKERLDLDTIKVKAQVDELNTEKAATDAAVTAARQQLASMQQKVSDLQVSLEAARKAPNSDHIAAAISQAASLGSAVNATTNELRTATQSTSKTRQISDYLVGIQTVGVPDDKRIEWNAAVQKAGYRLHENSASYDTAPTWFTQRPTILYYSRAASAAAQKLAELMKSLTGVEYALQRGSGLGVDPGEQDVTLFVHFRKP